MPRITYLLVSLALVLTACGDIGENEDDTLLAEVHQQKLFLSKASRYIAPGANAADSLTQLRAYVDQWVREMVLLNEAEQRLPSDLAIDELLRDYRNSLIVSNFEKSFVETQLDTVIGDRELQNYYQRNREQYQLEQTIVRCHFVKLPREADSIQQFREWWDGDTPEEFEYVADFSNRWAEVYLLEDSTWYRVDEIEQLMPPGTLQSQNIRPGTSLRFTDDDYEYYLSVSESVKSREIAPLSYIRDQAVRFIMHKRKLEMLEEMKSSLYKKDLSEGHIKIYVE